MTKLMCGLTEPKILTIWAFTKKFADIYINNLYFKHFETRDDDCNSP